MDKKLLFVQWLIDSGLSERTVKDYSYIAKRFPEHLEQADIDIYCSKNNRSIDRATIRNYVEFMIHNFPDEKLHYINLRIPKPKGRKKTKLPIYPTEDDLKRIIASLPSNRERMMALIQFYGALRPQGILNIKKGNFFLDEWLADRTKPCKVKIYESKTGERIIFLKKEVMELLYAKIKDEPTDKKLFNIKYRMWHYLLTTASKKALGYPISPHKLRHGGATWLLTKKDFTLQEVSEFLGHKSIATTQIYAHLDKEKMMEKYG